LVKGGRRRLALFAVAGLVSGVLSYFCFYVPVKLFAVPIVPGIVFGILVAGCNWMFDLREKFLFVVLIVFTTIAWVLAVNSTIGIYSILTGFTKEVIAGELVSEEPEVRDETPAELKKKIEHLPFSGAISGFAGGLVGGAVTVFGISIANRRFRRIQICCRRSSPLQSWGGSLN
jgi:membrane associated rhomboid family serine protease